MATYKLVRCDDDEGTLESVGEYDRSDDAYAAALKFGSGTYAGTWGRDENRYEDEIAVTDDYRVLIRTGGQDDWSEWDG